MLLCDERELISVIHNIGAEVLIEGNNSKYNARVLDNVIVRLPEFSVGIELQLDLRDCKFNTVIARNKNTDTQSLESSMMNSDG